MWNFRRGIDWANDPTGNTALANHCFIDGLSGSDANDGLTKSTPLKSLTQAKLLFGTSVIKVVAPWRYVDQLGSSVSFESHMIIGDSSDDDVIFIDTQGNRRGIGVDGCENIVISGYLNGCNNTRSINCTFIDCSGLYINRLVGCRLINSSPSNAPTGGTGGHNCYSCAFINSPLTLLHSNPAVTINIFGCYFDGSSTLNNTIPNVLNLTSNHFVNKITWDIPSSNYSTSNTDGDAYINGEGVLNYSFDPLQSPLFGRGYPDGFSNPRHMARYYIGQDFYTGVPAFDLEVANNPNLDVVNNELINIGSNDVEIIETPVITLDSLQALGVPHKVGILSYLSTLFGLNASAGNLDRVLEIKTAPTDTAVLGAYQKFRFGEQATLNGNGNPNGDDAYSWADNQPIFVKKFQARIGVVKAGVV